MCDVLVVEDDAEIRALLVEVLRDDGLVVCQAGSLAEAHAALASVETCRVLVVDHDLGEPAPANGFDFARHWMSAGDRGGAVYITGRWQHYERLLPHAARERCLPKPFRLDDLVGSVRELVAVSAPASTPQAGHRR